MASESAKDDIPMLVDDVDDESEAACIVISDSEDDEDDDDVMVIESTRCLFCVAEFRSVAEAIDHIQSNHGLNFTQLKTKFHMDQYSFIKLINYIRAHDTKPEDILLATDVLWSDEKYLKPKEYEPWLTYDYEEDVHADCREQVAATMEPMSEVDSLKLEIAQLKELVEKKRQIINDSMEVITKMRKAYHRLIDKESDAGERSVTLPKAINTIDDSYFSGYASFDIHHEMLSDSVRTVSYRDAFFKNKDIVNGKDVLDVGCGTAILSIFASKAGANRIVGIDNSEIIYNAEDVLKLNGNITNVALVKGRLEETELPQKEFDIIVSEWMGYFLLFEGMLDTVIYARDNHMRKGGILMPNRCTMSLVGAASDKLYQKYVTFWDDVHGVNMTNLRKELLHEPLITIVDPNDLITDACEIANFDLYTVELDYSNFVCDFKMRCHKSGTLSAIIGYFDSYFELPEPVVLKTSPNDEPTHWKQTVFLLEKPKEVSAGDMICGKITCRRSTKSDRSLDVRIDVCGNNQIFYLQ